MIGFEKIIHTTVFNHLNQLRGYQGLWPQKGSHPKGTYGWIADELLSLLADLHFRRISESIYNRRLDVFVRSVAKSIHDSKRYFAIYDEFIYLEQQPFPEKIRNCLIDDIVLIYILLGKGNQILAGVRKGVWWKSLETPPDDPLFWFSVGYQMLPLLGFIGRSELEFVPEKFLLLIDMTHLKIPKQKKSTTAYLRHAYFNQIYSIAPQGAQIIIRAKGDINGMIIKEITVDELHCILARIETTEGASIGYLHLDTGLGYAVDVGTSTRKSRILKLIAEIYDDIVTAGKTKPSLLKKLLGKSSDQPNKERKSSPYFTYLPRTARSLTTSATSFRVPYSGPRRPPEFHAVKGSFPNRPMTERHYKDLIDWQAKTGIRIPWEKIIHGPKSKHPPLAKIPSYKEVFAAGRTFARPHHRPVSESTLAALPLFIKKEIEEELAKSK
jgi:hypothetical protein